MKTCARCPKPTTSRGAKYCYDCRKQRQFENGKVQGKKSARNPICRIHVEPGEDYATSPEM